MWVLTVSSLRSSSRAATVVDSPSASSWRIWRWRPGQLAAASFRRHRGVDEALLGGRRVDRPAQLRGAGGAGDVGAGAGLQGGVGDVALGALAVGDDAERRRGPVQGADRLVAADRRIAGAVLAPAHVDDRDVEVADVADQVERLLAARGLVHVEVAGEDLANPEPDERVIVDDKAVGAFAQDCFRSLVCGSGPAAPCAPSVPILAQAGGCGRKSL